MMICRRQEISSSILLPEVELEFHFSIALIVTGWRTNTKLEYRSRQVFNGSADIFVS
jgi:hypothetical protein